MTQNPTGKERFALAALLSLLAILGPLNIDMYLPSFPDIVKDLDTNASLVQLSLTTCLIGLAVGQLVVGPISDALGRKRPMVVSIILFILASLLCAFAPNIVVLIIGRFLQGFTAAGGIVASRAVVRDVFSGPDLTKFFALLMVMNAMAPMLAPVAGGAILLLPNAHWNFIFFFLSLLGLIIVSFTSWRLKESLPVEKRTKTSLKKTFQTFGSLSRERSFIGYALTLGFAHGGSFAYVSGTPFVYQGIYNVSPQTFSLLFGVNGIAIITGTFIVGRCAGKIREQTILRTALLIASVATTVLLIMTLVKGPLFMIVGSIFVYMITMGMITTTSFSLAINKQGHRAGSASALLGMMPLFIGACVAPLVGLDESTAIPMGAIIFTSTIIALFSFFQIARKGERLEEKIAKHSVTS